MESEEDNLIQLSTYIIKKTGINITPEDFVTFATTIASSSFSLTNEPFHEQQRSRQDHHED